MDSWSQGSPRPTQYTDLIGGSEDQGSNYFDVDEFTKRAAVEESHYWHIHRNAVIRRSLERLGINKQDRLLEVGCGIGTVATHLNRHGYSVDYADIFSTALSFAYTRALSRLGESADERRYIRMDVTEDVPSWDYRVVLLLDVLEHLPDDVSALRHVKSALSGMHEDLVLFTVPAFQFLWSSWDDLEKHKRRYTKLSAGLLASNAGYEVVIATYFFSPLFFAAAAVKAARKLRNLAFPSRSSSTYERRMETLSNPLVNKILLSVLRPEHRWLRRHTIPLGTSILIAARPISGQVEPRRSAPPG